MVNAIAILLAWLIGFLLVECLHPVPRKRLVWAVTVFRASLAFGLGVGLTSIVFLLLDVAGAATPVTVFGSDVILLAIFGWRGRRVRARGQKAAEIAEGANDATPSFRWAWVLVLAFGAALLILGSREIQLAISLPVGEWDAWALWNLRAKFLAGPVGAWRYAVSPLINNTHPDYPLLLSAFVARAWKTSGEVDAFVPVATSLAFSTALLGLLVSAVALLRGTASAMLAGLVALSTTTLLNWVPAQYADIPLAFYMLSAIALVIFDGAFGGGSRGTLICAGLCASLAAYTKNEGIAFLAVITAVFCAFTLWPRRSASGWVRITSLLAGIAPGVLLTLWFKFVLAPPVDPLVTQGASGFTRLTDLSRYGLIVNGFFTNMLSLGSGVAHPLILLAILAILVRWQKEERYYRASLMGAVTLGLVFLSYCGAYLMTPYVLGWQLQSSFDRLILQIWPGALLIFFILLRSVADPVPLPVVSKSTPRKSAALSGKTASAAGKVK